MVWLKDNVVSNLRVLTHYSLTCSLLILAVHDVEGNEIYYTMDDFIKKHYFT